MRTTVLCLRYSAVAAPDLQNYLPASARYDGGEGGAGKPGTRAVYGGHSHVGTMIYNGDNWPAIYHDHLFTHNLHGHQLNHQHMVRTGSGYETFHAGYDLLYSPAEDYIPVDLQTGPDGAVYVIDWTDTQHCHNPDDEKWDRSNGRIYRISWKDTYKPVKVPEWDIGELFARVMNNSGSVFSYRDPSKPTVKGAAIDTEWSARTARRLIQEAAAKSISASGPQREALAHLFTRTDSIFRQDHNSRLSMLWDIPLYTLRSFERHFLVKHYAGKAMDETTSSAHGPFNWPRKKPGSPNSAPRRSSSSRKPIPRPPCVSRAHRRCRISMRRWFGRSLPRLRCMARTRDDPLPAEDDLVRPRV
ncbi:MAG: hypothetical protein R3F13_15175 [Prosthecobacter sp.]